jgi:hypothetical protein
MPVERVEANPLVKEDLGRLAVRRGPMIYCMEAVDQTAPVEEVVLPREAKLKPTWRGDLLGGLTEITGTGQRITQDQWEKQLYQAASPSESTQVRLIPYCYWDNRKPGAMEVWLPSAPPPAKAGGPESRAKVSISYLSGNAQIDGVNDGSEPKASGESTNRLTHWWPHKGTEEWIAYTWKKPLSISGVKVYWFDDTGRGECRLPREWHLERMEAGKWVPIAVANYPVEKDKWTEVNFPTLHTDAIRLVLKLQDGWAAGVRQWRVIEADE